ncbi:MAG: hypothetical protein AAGF81_06510 [Pseudomonadota bacterium]
MSDRKQAERAAQGADRAQSVPPEVHNPLGEPKNMARLKMAIAIMSVLLVGGTVVVIGTIIYRAMTYESKSSSQITAQGAGPLQGFSKLDVEVERGTLVSQIEIDGDRMAVHVTKAAADEILIINIRSGELIGRVNLKEKPLPGGAD